MALLDYCNEEAILCEMAAQDKEDALRQLVDALVTAKSIPKSKATAIRKEIIERERRATTGIGAGVGIPHARTKHVRRISIAIGRIREGIDFGAVDGEPVRIIVLMVSPLDRTNEHLAAMKQIVSLARDSYQNKRLHGCTSSASFLDLIRENDG